MKKPAHKKLKVRAETLRELSTQALKAVAGGNVAPARPSQGSNCAVDNPQKVH